MNTRHFDYIIEAAETLNFNKAAENLFISQPALSYQIKAIEEEIGFNLFERRGRSVSLTPAGQQFYQQIKQIRHLLQESIEEGQNFSQNFTQNIRIGIPQRSMLYFLPEVMQSFAQTHPHVLITPVIYRGYGHDAFLNKEVDLHLTTLDEAKHLTHVDTLPLYKSKVYFLTCKQDVLAKKKSIKASDLEGRRLLVNGGSSLQLRRVQEATLKATPSIRTMNSPSHDFTMIQVSAGHAVCLSPGYLNDFSKEFAWIPFETKETFECVLLRHPNQKSSIVDEFVSQLQATYQEKARTYKL